MRVRKPCAALLAGLVLVLSATPSMAQHPGFRIGIAPIAGPPGVISGFGQPMVVPFGIAPVAVFPQSTFGFPPTQAPVIVTRGGFVTQPFGGYLVQTPSVIVPGQNFALNPFPVPGQVVPNPFVGGGQVVPNPYIIGGQVFAPGQVVWPGSVFTQTPRTHSTPANTIPIPGVGTPRAHVLTQLGQPTVSIITSTGETLFFNGGITVFIQNGQVAVPR